MAGGWAPAQVTLADGRQVASDSREYLLETEAAYVLSLPLPERRPMLDSVEKRRGLAGRQALEERVRSLWILRKGLK